MTCCLRGEANGAVTNSTSCCSVVVLTQKCWAVSVRGRGKELISGAKPQLGRKASPLEPLDCHGLILPQVQGDTCLGTSFVHLLKFLEQVCLYWEWLCLELLPLPSTSYIPSSENPFHLKPFQFLQTTRKFPSGNHWLAIIWALGKSSCSAVLSSASNSQVPPEGDNGGTFWDDFVGLCLHSACGSASMPASLRQNELQVP